jgi:hypothetical protein
VDSIPLTKYCELIPLRQVSILKGDNRTNRMWSCFSTDWKTTSTYKPGCMTVSPLSQQKQNRRYKKKKNGASLLFCPILQSSLHKISSFSYPFLFLCVVMSCKVSESSRREQDRRQLQLTVRAACSYTWMHPNSQYSLSTWTLISASCQNEALHIASSPSLHLECTYFSLSTGLQTPLHFQSNDATQTLPACAFHLQSEGPFQRANTG